MLIDYDPNGLKPVLSGAYHERLDWEYFSVAYGHGVLIGDTTTGHGQPPSRKYSNTLESILLESTGKRL